MMTPESRVTHDTPAHRELARLLKETRQERGQSQAETAAEMGLKQHVIERLELCLIAKLDIETLAVIAHWLGTDLNRLSAMLGFWTVAEQEPELFTPELLRRITEVRELAAGLTPAQQRGLADNLDLMLAITRRQVGAAPSRRQPDPGPGREPSTAMPAWGRRPGFAPAG